MNNIEFIKMNAAGNDFIILDARKQNISLTSEQITKISARYNIGCDQLIILRQPNNAYNANLTKEEIANRNIIVFMEIFNSDGSQAKACGNATRAVAGLIFEDIKLSGKKIIIATIVDLLECWQEEDGKIAVAFTKAKFANNNIPLIDDYGLDSANIKLFNHNFAAVNVGNPHLVTFTENKITDEEFFNIAPKIENHQYFPEKINVEFAQIIDDNNIAVRVWERGAKETLACGSGACGVAALAIINKYITSKRVNIHFKGGIITISWSGDIDSRIIMIGDYQKIFLGFLSEDFLI